jgi:hypothetical protein
MATLDTCAKKGCLVPGNTKQVHNPNDLGGKKAKDYEVYELSAKDGQACTQLSKDNYNCRCMWILRSYEPQEKDVPGSPRKKDAEVVDETLVGTWIYAKDFIQDDRKRARIHAVICAKLSEDQYKHYVTLRPLPEAGHAPKTDEDYEKDYTDSKKPAGGQK